MPQPRRVAHRAGRPWALITGSGLQPGLFQVPGKLVVTKAREGSVRRVLELCGGIESLPCFPERTCEGNPVPRVRLVPSMV